MVVSKRGLLKVIILLVIIDIIAGFWYLTLRIENSGESRDLWHPDSVTETADTIAEETVPDSFEVVSKHGYFVTQQHVDTSGTPLASIKTVKARIPLSVNGCDSLDLLLEALMKKAFGLTARDFDEAMAQYADRPHFNSSIALSYNKVESEPNVGAAHTTIERVFVYPLYTSHRLMVMEIDYWRNNCGRKSVTSAYVHYDRMAQQEITRSDIINATTESLLLSIINEKIDALNKKDPKLKLHAAAKVPTEMCVRKNGTSFMFIPGEIGEISQGEIEIMVSHDNLKNVYTPMFQRLLSASTGWWKYNKLSTT